MNMSSSPTFHPEAGAEETEPPGRPDTDADPGADVAAVPVQARPAMDDAPMNAPDGTSEPVRRHPARTAVRAVRVFATTAAKVLFLGRDADL